MGPDSLTCVGELNYVMYIHKYKIFVKATRKTNFAFILLNSVSFRRKTAFLIKSPLPVEIIESSRDAVKMETGHPVRRHRGLNFDESLDTRFKLQP